MTDQFSTVIIDYRGLGESTDDYSMEPSTQLFADDIIGLLDHLNMKSVCFVGLVGIGACIGQWVAVKRPDLVRCMVNMGCWTWADPMPRTTFRPSATSTNMRDFTPSSLWWPPCHSSPTTTTPTEKSCWAAAVYGARWRGVFKPTCALCKPVGARYQAAPR